MHNLCKHECTNWQLYNVIHWSTLSDIEGISIKFQLRFKERTMLSSTNGKKMEEINIDILILYNINAQTQIYCSVGLVPSTQQRKSNAQQKF